MKKRKRTKVAVEITFSLQAAINSPGRVSFVIGPWTHHDVTVKQAQRIIAKYLRTRVFDPYAY